MTAVCVSRVDHSGLQTQVALLIFLFISLSVAVGNDIIKWRFDEQRIAFANEFLQKKFFAANIEAIWIISMKEKTCH